MTICLSVPAYLLFTYVYLLFAFSGSPYATRMYEKRIQYANRICIFIAVTRIGQGLLLFYFSLIMPSVIEVLRFNTNGNPSKQIFEIL
jgi:hypothetical protein